MVRLFKIDVSIEPSRPISPPASDPSTAIVHHQWNNHWTVLDNHGIEASFKDDLLVFHDIAGDYSTSRAAEATLQLPSATIGDGFIVSYDVRWVNMAYDSVASINFPVWPTNAKVPQLRFNNGRGSWGILEKRTGEFSDLGKSSTAADGVWRTVLYHYAPTSVTVFEDGDLVFTQDFDRLTLGPVVESLSITMSSFDNKSMFHAEVRNVVTIPTAFNTDLSSPSSTHQATDITFTTSYQTEIESLWSVVADIAGPVAARYTPRSLQFYIPDSTNRYDSLDPTSILSTPL